MRFQTIFGTIFQIPITLFLLHYCRSINGMMQLSDYFLQNRTSYLLCAITKVHDVSYYLPQWFEYHILAGIEQFFVADDCGDAETRYWLEFYRSFGYVTIIEQQVFRNLRNPTNCSQHRPNEKRMSMFLFQAAKPNCTWVISFDADENVLPAPRVGDPRPALGVIPATLASLRERSLQLPWIMVSAHGRIHRADDLIIEAYTLGARHYANHVCYKTLAQSACASGWLSPHFPEWVASDDCLPPKPPAMPKGSCAPPARSPLYIRHFRHWSLFDYMQTRGKRAFNAAGGVNAQRLQPLESWRQHNATAQCVMFDAGSDFLRDMSRLVQASVRLRLERYRQHMNNNNSTSSSSELDYLHWRNGSILL